MLHAMLKWLVERGHEAAVIVGDDDLRPSQRSIDGVGISEPDEALYKWCDVVITHLDLTHWVLGVARFFKKPLVHLVHNQWQLAFHGIENADLVVFNSHWMAKEVDWTNGPWMVVHPPVWVKDYKVEHLIERGYTTLINLSIKKGVQQWLHMARAMRDREFLGVMGSYGVQIYPGAPNIKYVENAEDVRDIYEVTNTIVMPSSYESFGRVAVEAACSGIPTVCTPTPGLVESLGRAGIFVAQNDINWWVHELRRLEDKDYYQERSLLSLQRAEILEQQSLAELPVFEEALLNIESPI